MSLKNKCLCIPNPVLLNRPNAVTFNTAPHAVVSPNYKIIYVATSYYNFATAMNYNVNLRVFLRF